MQHPMFDGADDGGKEGAVGRDEGGGDEDGARIPNDGGGDGGRHAAAGIRPPRVSQATAGDTQQLENKPKDEGDGRLVEDASEAGHKTYDDADGGNFRGEGGHGVGGTILHSELRGEDSEGNSCQNHFKLLSKVPLDPKVFNSSRRLSKGETGRVRRNQRHENEFGLNARLVTPNLSNSITDTNIYNCNRRIRDLDSGTEELRLWGIAKEIGVVCQEC